MHYASASRSEFNLREDCRRLARAVLLLLCLFVGLAAPALAAAPEITGLRFGINGERVRLVIDSTEALPAQVRVLDSPPRLVVDLPDVRWRVREHPQNRPRGIATGLRYGRVDTTSARLVVDMDRPFAVVGQQKLPPSADFSWHRTVIDFAPSAAPPPATVKKAQPRTVAKAPPSAPARTAEPARGAAPLPVHRPSRAPETTLAGLPASAPARAARQAPRSLPMIVLDAGHGGIDPGTVGASGILEKDIVLAMARQLAARIEASGRYRVALTRDSDEYIRLRERIALARRHDADLFISLHADSLGDPEFRGASVYTLSETASDAEAARLAAKENKADIIAGTDLSQHDEVVASILIDLAQRDTNNKSISLAEHLIETLKGVTHLIGHTRRYAGFAVLKAPDTPSVLIELGYLSNETDARNLADPAHREKLAGAILQAIDRYFTGL